MHLLFVGLVCNVLSERSMLLSVVGRSGDEAADLTLDDFSDCSLWSRHLS